MRQIQIDSFDLPANDRRRETFEPLLAIRDGRVYATLEVICEAERPVMVRKMEKFRLGGDQKV
jgi:hypothetical protein